MSDSSSNSNEVGRANSTFPVATTTFLQGITDQNAEAWQKLVRIYGPVVFYWCRKKGASGDDAADIGQEVFRAVLIGIHRFERSSQHAFLSWLKTITHHKITDYWRQKERIPDVVGGTEFKQAMEQSPGPSCDGEVSWLGDKDKVYGPGGQRGGGGPSNEGGPSDDGGPCEDGLDEGEGSSVEAIIVRKTLAELKSKFTQKTWKAFWETAVNNRISSDVAEDLQMTAMAVRKAKSRVLRQLRQHLGSHLGLGIGVVSEMSQPDD